MPSGNTIGELLDNHVATAKWGWKCADKHSALSDVVRDFNQAITEDGKGDE